MKKQILFMLSMIVTTLLIAKEQDSLKLSDSIPLLDTINFHTNRIVKYKEDTITLNLQESKDTEAVLKTGFSQNMNSFSLNTATTDAGKTVGVLDVSLTGAATYTIPISLPPGINGMVPQIALVYNSQSGNGTAGYGWNVTGYSAITRIAATKFHDGRVGGINLNFRDRFALDGQRLILKSGMYGSDGSEYTTESYSNIKVIARGISPNGGSFHGPAYFEVYYPNGTKAYYGIDNNSRNAAVYGLSYQENAVGARISYTYINEYNILYLAQISYGSKNTILAINTINFTYKSRIRNEQYYAGNQSIFNSKILSEINVTANGNPFRKYELVHSVPSLKYERLTQVQEVSGDGMKKFEPIYFTYGNSSPSSISHQTISNLYVSGVQSTNSNVITGDFTGDGTLDFFLYPTTKNKVLAFLDPTNPANHSFPIATEYNTGNFRDIFPVTLLSANNKLNHAQGFVLVKNSYTEGMMFEVYATSYSSPVVHQYTKQWTNPPMHSYYSECLNTEVTLGEVPKAFFSGDFNGDGLSDIVCITYPYSNVASQTPVEGCWSSYPEDCCTLNYQNFSSSKIYLIDLARNSTQSSNISSVGNLSFEILPGDKVLTADFNGDGKTDILHITPGRMNVYAFNEYNYLDFIWQTNDSRITLNFAPLLGDYNGDGKMDIMFPVNDLGPNHNVFATFLSRGTSFLKQEQTYPFVNQRIQTSPTIVMSSLIANDINGDGKSDMIRIISNTQNNSTQGSLEIQVYSNIGSISSAGALAFTYIGNNNISGNLRNYPIPVFFTPDKYNLELKLGVISDATLNLFSFDKSLKKEVSLSSVYQDGISYYLDYTPLLTTFNYLDDIPAYQEDYAQVYPYFDIKNSFGFEVVKKLRRLVNTVETKQVFGYKGAVGNMEGLGFSGFTEVTRSNWHLNTSDINRLFTINIYDPLLRGAANKSFVSKNFNINPTIKNVNALNNINPTTGINDGASLNDYIIRTDHIYQTQLHTDKVFVNIPLTISNKDLLHGVASSQSFTYDAYNNVNLQTNNVAGNNIVSTVITYDNNATLTNYYFGRPLTKITTQSNGSDTYITEEQYTYTGHLPTQIKRKGNNTSFITENLTYDSFGNVLSKTLITADGQRTSSSTYDPSGRFLLSATDTEGMTTSYTYSTATGNVLSKTNPYSQTESYVYDSWNRIIETTDYLGKKSYKSYIKDFPDIIINESNEEGAASTKTINALGQITKEGQKNLFGQWIYNMHIYDEYDRLKFSSEPYNGASFPSQMTETIYDEYGRLKTINSFTGKTTQITYNGLSTTVNDGTKSVTTTKNALGQITSVQDPGGTINYIYDAAGNLKTANYDGIAQQITYDGWGRKIQLTDPSAGTYNYEYNQFGETTKEISPKGITIYTYQPNTGKLLAKTLIGDNTQMSWTYTYDGSTKLLNSLALTNADGNNASYTYTYDSNKRPASIVEDNLHARFVKSFTYDDFGRINTETSEAKNKANNKIASKTLQYHYQYGEVLKVTDQVSGLRIHEIQSLNERGQVLTALMGNNLKQNDGYDSYGLPQSFVTQRLVGNPTNLMNLSYTFNVQRALLTNRSNSAFSWNESFAYDSQDRLTNFNDNNGNNSHIYDNKGRITNNSQLGDYTYNNYQQTQLNNLVSTAHSWYQDRALQQINYNAFKSPVEINEEGKERISFQYNAGLQRAHIYYGSTATEKMDRPYRRHYSEDGTMEITEDIQNGTTNFVFYLGGDAYSAPAIWKEIHHSNAQPLDAQLYFLHRDHLGSIVMITDAAGNIAEKRQFDAWGNIVKLENGNGVPLTAFVILDRGYTGHEHLLGVALIHMNGRLYDPKLHRFLQPDNYVQDPYNSQNFNRYGYVYNNPLSHVDPSGEFIHLIVGAVIGGVINWAANGAKFSWKGLAHFGIGALSGALGAGVGAGVSSALGGGTFGAGFLGTSAAKAVGSGFLSGAVVGGSGGFAGGFTGGFGNALVNGSSFSSALGAGLKGGAMGALGGSLIGGTVSGLDAMRDGRNFWTGAGESRHEMLLSGTGNGNQYTSNEDMWADYNSNIGSRDGMSLSQVEAKLNTNVSLADGNLKGYSINGDGLLTDSNGGTYGGVTTDSWSGGVRNRLLISRIEIAPGVKGYELTARNMVFKHEFMHAWHRTFMTPGAYNTFSERAASTFSYIYTKAYPSLNWMMSSYQYMVRPIPPSYGWREFSKIIPLWIK